MRFTTLRGFTIVEIIVVVSVIATLVGVSVFGYGSWQRQQAMNSIKSDLSSGVSGLRTYKNFKENYPPNIAGTGFASSRNVAITLRTNATSTGVYDNLSDPQNAQLFLNVCNANIFTIPDNAACGIQSSGGNARIHVKGIQGFYAIWDSPIELTDLTLSCGSNQASCNQALSQLTSQFNAQGGTFPIIVPGSNVSLPEPTMAPHGTATRYCIEGRATEYTDIVYYALSDDPAITAGKCPVDPSLRYFN